MLAAQLEAGLPSNFKCITKSALEHAGPPTLDFLVALGCILKLPARISLRCGHLRRDKRPCNTRRRDGSNERRLSHKPLWDRVWTSYPQPPAAVAPTFPPRTCNLCIQAVQAAQIIQIIQIVQIVQTIQLHLLRSG